MPRKYLTGLNVALGPWLLATMVLVAGGGCGSTSQPNSQPNNQSEQATATRVEKAPPAVDREQTKPPIDNRSVVVPSSTPREASEVVVPRPPPRPDGARILGDLLSDNGPLEATASKPNPSKPSFDQGKIAAAGIRRIESKHLVLYTDLPQAAWIEELPKVFDLAVPQWCEYFGVDLAEAADWQMIGSLIDQQNRFAGAGLLPADLPEFPHGYHRGWQFWVYKQPSEYYGRHLVLHEGTHAFMRHFLGGAGPPWFMEGMAEYLGTHTWEEDQLTLRVMPESKETVPYWGRVKIIQDDFAANRGQTLENVLALGPQAHRQTEAYAWSWAAVMLLAEHADSRQAMHDMLADVQLSAAPFAAKLRERVGEDWDRLRAQWQLFVVGMDYGYDIQANSIVEAPLQALPPAGADFVLDATRGWQSSGYRIEAGVKYRLTATGQFQLAGGNQPWPSEAGGVTIRYYRGRPLGMLLAAVVPTAAAANGLTPLLSPREAGLATEIVAEHDGVLYLSINEDPSQFQDNQGSLTVRIQSVQ